MKRHGFSLLEVLVVLALIALTTTVSVVALRWQPSRAADERERLLSARSQAIATGQMVSGFADSIGSFTAYPSGVVLTASAPFVTLTLGADAK